MSNTLHLVPADGSRRRYSSFNQYEQGWQTGDHRNDGERLADKLGCAVLVFDHDNANRLVAIVHPKCGYCAGAGTDYRQGGRRCSVCDGKRRHSYVYLEVIAQWEADCVTVPTYAGPMRCYNGPHATRKLEDQGITPGESQEAYLARMAAARQAQPAQALMSSLRDTVDEGCPVCGSIGTAACVGRRGQPLRVMHPDRRLVPA